ncbi:MAG TPA: alcohol dehydrogenase catalytic domain-containing protein [Methanomassiliicoccales archaeon]|nr:alcohol dehydrogenase catalytic domain-containing protein [Methanomassiliicoccales archaeon]
MKAALMHGPGKLALEDVPDPLCPPGGVLLDLVACAICGTDAKMLEAGHRDLSYPRILGHEIVARVAEIDGPGYKVGELVQVWPGIACGECRPCRRGADNQCSSIGILGFNYDGGFAQQLALPARVLRERTLFPLPDGSDAAKISLAEPLACCINGQELARVGLGDTVLIFGAGPLGCLHALLAKWRGAGKVIMTEHLESRRGQLPSHLADLVIDPAGQDIVEAVKEFTNGDGADVVLMATPEVKVENWLLRLMAPQGRISVFSGPKKGNYEVPWDVRTMHYKEISLVGAYGCSSRSNMEAVAMILNDEIDVGWLVTERIALDDLGAAFLRSNQRIGMKSVVDRF